MHDTKVPIADAKNFSAAADCRMLLLCLKMHFAEKKTGILTILKQSCVMV